MQITARNLDNLQLEIQAGDHLFIADETKNDGGDDAGPSPYALLLSSLAACKIITVQLYARRKQWPVASITMRLSHKKVFARDCEDCESDPNTKVDIIESEISFEGDLNDEQKTRLAEIADRCPVHRSLTSETKIRTRLVDNEQ